MKKSELVGKTEKVKQDTKSALQTLWGNINKGQQKQLIKRKEIKEPFERYGNVDTCVCCGEPVPEGRMVCPICEERG